MTRRVKHLQVGDHIQGRQILRIKEQPFFGTRRLYLEDPDRSVWELRTNYVVRSRREMYRFKGRDFHDRYVWSREIPGTVFDELQMIEPHLFWHGTTAAD